MAVLQIIVAVPQVPVIAAGKAIAITPRTIPAAERPKIQLLRRVKAKTAPTPNRGIATPISACAVPAHLGIFRVVAIGVGRLLAGDDWTKFDTGVGIAFLMLAGVPTTADTGSVGDIATGCGEQCVNCGTIPIASARTARVIPRIRDTSTSCKTMLAWHGGRPDFRPVVMEYYFHNKPRRVIRW
jgi:hypothetical protein